jgi:hypothetical protein
MLMIMSMGDWWNDCDTETPKRLKNTLLLRHFVRNVFCSAVPRLCLLGAVTTCFKFVCTFLISISSSTAPCVLKVGFAEKRVGLQIG